MRRRSAFQSKPAVFSLKCSTKAGGSNPYWCCVSGVSASCASSASVQSEWQNEQWTTAAPDARSSSFFVARFDRVLCSPPRRTCDACKNPYISGSSDAGGTSDAYGIDPCNGCSQCTRSFHRATAIACTVVFGLATHSDTGRDPYCSRVRRKWCHRHKHCVFFSSAARALPFSVVTLATFVVRSMWSCSSRRSATSGPPFLGGASGHPSTEQPFACWSLNSSVSCDLRCAAIRASSSLAAAASSFDACARYPPRAA